MHVEHNVSKSVLKYLFGEKDTLEMCKDLKQLVVAWATQAFIRLGRVFQHLCTKVMNPYEINPFHTFVVETLCMLEV